MHYRKSVYFQTFLTLFLLVVSAYVIKYKIAKMPHYTIGLVYVPSRAFHEYLGDALIKKITSDKTFNVEKFSSASSSDWILVNATCNEAIESKVDLVICIGMHCTKGALQCSLKRQSKKPIIFLGLVNALQNNLVKSISRPGGNITGIESNAIGKDTLNLADLLITIKPNFTSLLLPYSTSFDGNEMLVYEIEKKCSEAGRKAKLLPINNMGETLIKVSGLITCSDTIMYLEGDGISIYGSGLGKLASQYNTTMFAGSIDGIKDSAISYVADPASLASEAFEIAKEILINKRNPGDMPVRQATVPRNLIINTKLCQEQDLADIDIPAVVQRIRSDARFAAVHDHIIIDGVKYE